MDRQHTVLFLRAPHVHDYCGVFGLFDTRSAPFRLNKYGAICASRWDVYLTCTLTILLADRAD
eukprot:6191941-Pleurochrysis_carterae.AAC.6